MTPILYPSTENQFTSNGIGILADAVSCIVTEELNGEYELEMQYPITGIHYSEIKNRCLLFCDANRERNPQPFRIYRITKPINGIVTIYAAHISYDLSGIPVKPFTSGSAAAAITALETGAAVASPFSFWTDKTNAGNLAVATPLSSRAALGARDNSILGVYGGELEFDRYSVRLHGQRGTDRGVTIRYGKNLTSIEQDEDISNVYTGVYPYYTGGDNITQLDELIVPAPGTYDYERILPLDLSTEFDDAPTKAQLKAAAEEYITNNNIGVPEISIAVSFAQLEQTEEYKDIALLETVYMGDTVHVEFANLGVSASARCVKTVYNVLLDRYDSIELGDAQKNIADTIAAQQLAINSVASQPVSTAVQNAINAATELITGNKGGYVLMHSTTDSKQPDEILIMDKPTIEEAVKVWRWNNAGLGYSSTGYNGPYKSAITQDGRIVADFITAGGMDAARITAGVLSSADGRVKFDLTAGTLYIKDGSGTTRLGFDSSGNLTVRGTIYASSGEFTGKITSSSGTIGGFTISSEGLTAGSEDTYIALNNPTSIAARLSLGYGYVEYDAVPVLGVGDSITVSPNLNVVGNLGVGDTLYIDLPSSSGGEAVYWGESTRRFVYHGSSERYKKDIETITDEEALKLLEVRPVTFRYKDNADMPSTLQYGVIAEETQPIYPAMIGYKDGEINSMHYEQLFAPIIRLLQIQQQEINELKKGLN